MKPLPLWLLSSALTAAGWPGAFAHQGSHATPDASSAAVTGSALSRSTVQVRLPAVRVRQQSGRLLNFDVAVDDTRPVLLNFFYTTCTGICLQMSKVFAAAQERLGPDADQVQMISVSIDPTQDTPARLAEYAEHFAAGPQWSFATGSQEAIDALQRAFNVYRSDKMSHMPVTFIRSPGSRHWVRLDGFASPDQLLREARMQATATP